MSLNNTDFKDTYKREERFAFPFHIFKNSATWMFFGLCLVNFLYGCTATINGVKWYRFFIFIWLIFGQLLSFQNKRIIPSAFLSVLFCFHTILAFHVPYFLPLTSSLLALLLYFVSNLPLSSKSGVGFAMHGFIIGILGMIIHLMAPETIYWLSFPFAINIWFLWVGTKLLIKTLI